MRKLGVKEYFNKYAKEHEEQKRESYLWYRWFVDNMIKESLPVDGKRILDLGTGSGTIAIRLAEHAKDSCRIIGIDVSEEMVREAERICEEGGLKNVEFRIMRIEDIDFPAGSFDLVVSSLAMDHVKDMKSVLGRIFESLNSGGKFVIGLFFQKREKDYEEKVNKLRQMDPRATKEFDGDWHRFLTMDCSEGYRKEHPEEIEIGPSELRDMMTGTGFIKVKMISSLKPEIAIVSGIKP